MLSLHNHLGQLVSTYEQNLTSNKTFKIETGGLPDGLYFLSVEGKDWKVVEQLAVIGE